MTAKTQFLIGTIGLFFVSLLIFLNVEVLSSERVTMLMFVVLLWLMAGWRAFTEGRQKR